MLHRQRLPLALAAAFISLAVAAGGQDWRGSGRIQGKLVDPDGKPVAGATLKANNPERGGGPTVKSDDKGRWVLGGIAAGNWQIDIEAEGYLAKKIAITLPAEASRLAPLEVPLEPAKGTVGPSPELVALAAAADAAYKAGRFDEARAEYEKLLEVRPDLAPRVHQQIGFSYVQEKQFDKALEQLDMVLAAEPDNAQVRAVAAQAAIQGGQLDRARGLLQSLDQSKVTSADVFFSLGIDFFNAGQSKEAADYLGKAIALDPVAADAYYRRALAYLGLGQTAEARADFQKVVELQPEGEMAAMSRKALESLK